MKLAIPEGTSIFQRGGSPAANAAEGRQARRIVNRCAVPPAPQTKAKPQVTEKTTKTKPQVTETKLQETKLQELSVGTNMPNTKYTAARDVVHLTRQANGLAVLSGYRSSRVREQPIYELRVDAHHERDATIFLERL